LLTFFGVEAKTEKLNGKLVNVSQMIDQLIQLVTAELAVWIVTFDFGLGTTDFVIGFQMRLQ
jgi:hypothetical protein